MFESSRLFLYLGLGLVFLALITFPTNVMIQIQQGDFDDVSIGWLFAPIIGAWGLASVTLGITEAFMSRKEALLCLLPVFAFIYIGLGFASWMVTVYGESWFWRVYFGLLLFPCLIANTAAILYFAKKEKFAHALKNQRTRSLAFIALIAVPLLYTAIFLLVFALFS
jgi:hypothetical protein